MLATQKDLCCLIQPTSILSRNPGINKWLTNVSTDSDSSIVDCRPIENSNQRCNQHWSELNSVVEGRENRYSTARSELRGDRPGSSLPDPINQALRTAVDRCEVHQINTIVFGCYRDQKKLAPGGKANNQKFVQIPAAKSSSFTAERGSSRALTTPLTINFFAVLSQKVYIEASPFLSCGGVLKHQ